MPIKLSTFNDGVLTVCREKDRKTDFGAKRNASTLADLEEIVTLAYQESSKRAQDLEFAEQAGFQLSMKVKTRFRPEVSSKHKAVIGGYLYDIRYLDVSRATMEMYLYLEQSRRLEDAQ